MANTKHSTAREIIIDRLVIKDGIVEESGLAVSGMSGKEIKKLLDDNATGLDNVFLLTVKRGGDYDLIRKDTGK